MMFWSLGLGTVVAIALIAVVSVLTGGKATPNNASTSALVGTHVQSFSLGGLNGGTESAPWTSGRASVLIFFASWCGPCKSEMPKVAAYLRAHDPSPVEVLGIDANDQRAAAQAMVRKDGVNFPVAFDANGVVTSGVFSFLTVPETVFINAKGVVTQVYFGAIPAKQLAQGIKSLRSA
ncbi:MAG TPA: TlpA disulfide reductase family protein [Acidimicrobiales bacterium]|nr:TlpA disulfide reductase family protein [Acidimicrobiales bacterium]